MSMPHMERHRHDPRATVATNHIVPRGEARIAKKKQKGKIAKAGSQTRNLHFIMDTTYHWAILYIAHDHLDWIEHMNSNLYLFSTEL